MRHPRFLVGTLLLALLAVGASSRVRAQAKPSPQTQSTSASAAASAEAEIMALERRYIEEFNAPRSSRFTAKDKVFSPGSVRH